MTDSGWEKFRLVTYSYNEAKQLVEEVTQSMNEDTLTLLSRVIYHHDEVGNRVQIHRESWGDNQWVSVLRSTFQFVEDRINRRLDSIWNNNQLTLMTTSYAYNDSNNLVAETSQKMEGEYTNHSKILYQYNKEGIVIKKEFPRWNGDHWENQRMMTLEYNSHNYHVKTIRYNWFENDWVENIRYDLEVDIDGNRLNELWRRDGKDVMRITYTYK